MAKEQQILPRILRYRNAPGYLGMCREVFNKTVRPFVKEFAIGNHGVGFDRHELDEWADKYIAEHAIAKPAGGTSSASPARHIADQARIQQQKSDFESVLELVRRRR